MTNYLIAEMLLYLLGTAVLGMIAGWFFTRTSYKRKVEDTEVNLLSRMHDVQKELDISRHQQDRATELLETERASNSSGEEVSRLSDELELAKKQADYSKSQILDLNHTLDTVTKNLRKAKSKQEQQEKDKIQMQQEFDAIKQRLSIFQADLLEIVENSSHLRTAFDNARLQLVEKDRRIAELEAVSSEDMQLAAVSNHHSEPDLAISRIARLQKRVQELFDEVSLKDAEIERLKSVPANDIIGSFIDHGTSDKEETQDREQINIDSTDVQLEDDLTLILGIDDILENRLKDLGINYLKDIADWDDDDIDRIDSELQNFPGRIQAERWVEQAQDLCHLSALGTSH